MTMTGGDRFDIGRVVQRTFAVLGRNASAFVPAALVLSALPLALQQAIALAFRPSMGRDLVVTLEAGLVGFLMSLFALAGSVLLQGALIFGTVSDLNGRRPSFTEMLRVAVGVAWPLVGIAILVALGVGLGLVLLLVPGIILALMWCVAAPARVVENVGVMGALGRSRELTKGHRWMILLLFLIILVINWVLLAVLGAVGLAASGGFSGIMAMATQPIAFGSVLWFGSVIVQPIVSSLVGLLGAAGIASLYYELRTVKEGVGAEALAAAFA